MSEKSAADAAVPSVEGPEGTNGLSGTGGEGPDGKSRVGTFDGRSAGVKTEISNQMCGPITCAKAMFRYPAAKYGTAS